MTQYEDIINLPHHVSERHARMSMLDRVAQFSPFAALTGYDAAIEETARLTDAKIELDESEKDLLNKRLREALASGTHVRISYFLPDERKVGGAYVCITGKVKKLDTLGDVEVIDYKLTPYRNDDDPYFAICPDCGKPIGIHNDGGNGFCTDCGIHH